MIVGFNHNITYRGTGFHVQTEDSGVKKAQLVTLLYHGGTIIGSHKTTYADIIKVNNLEKVVEDLAKEQHKGMLKRLTRGEFDQRIGEMGISIDIDTVAPIVPPPVPKPAVVVEPAVAVKPVTVATLPEVPAPIVEAPVVVKAAVAAPTPAKPIAPVIEVPVAVVHEEPVAVVHEEPVTTIIEEPIIDKFSQRRTADEPSLEELIYSYLTAGQG